MMLRIDSRTESKSTYKRSFLMKIPRLISLLILHISIQELIFTSELIQILESILIPFPGHIATARSIPIPELILISELILIQEPI